MSWLSWCKWDSPYTSFPFRGFSNITSCGKIVIAALNYVTEFRCFSVALDNSWVPFRNPLKWHSLQLTMIMIWNRWSPFPDAPKTSSCFSCFVLPHGQMSPKFNVFFAQPSGTTFFIPKCLLVKPWCSCRLFRHVSVETFSEAGAQVQPPPPKASLFRFGGCESSGCFDEGSGHKLWFITIVYHSYKL